MATGSGDEAGQERRRYVTRAGVKLEHALATFGLDVTGMVCADFGCHAGGFTDCLLQHGAARVYAVDTGYGTLAWSLRNDPRVTVMERTNALHAEPAPGGVDLVTIDLGWTRQRHAIPAALRWLRPGGRIVTLIKPHYEAEGGEEASRLVDGALSPADAEAVFQRTLAALALPGTGVVVVASTVSPIEGAKSSRRGAGNREWLALLKRVQNPLECPP